jgi:hypothetical protein
MANLAAVWATIAHFNDCTFYRGIRHDKRLNSAVQPSFSKDYEDFPRSAVGERFARLVPHS